jgi:hypothetical protein
MRNIVDKSTRGHWQAVARSVDARASLAGFDLLFNGARHWQGRNDVSTVRVERLP